MNQDVVKTICLAVCLLSLACVDFAVTRDAGSGDGHIADGEQDRDGFAGECADDADCEEGDGCTLAFCFQDECHHSLYPDGFECNDGSPCSVGDRCISGVCTGRHKDCSSLDGPCIDGSCDPESGDCVAVTSPDGSECDDGLYCTERDTCIAGVCAGTPTDCDDGDVCTQEECNEDEDYCEYRWEQKPGLEGPYYDPSCTNGMDDDCDEMTDGDDPDCADTCSGQIRALAAEIYATDQGCTAVVRLDYETMEMLSYQLVCGPYRTATCQAGSGVVMLSPPDAEDECVYYVTPLDFGWASAVSVATSLLVFEAEIVWMGTGRLLFPTDWRPASELGSQCLSVVDIPSTRGYSLIPDGSTLPPGDVDAAIYVVRDTAILAAFSDGGYVHSAVVLLYPRTVGMFDPHTAEWIVLINGGP